MPKIQSLETLKNIAPSALPAAVGVTGFPLNMHEVVRQMPVVFKQNTCDVQCVRELSGKIYLNSERMPVVWLNPFDRQNYQRHTLAHMLSHLLLEIIPNLDNPDADLEFHETKLTLRMDARQDPKEYKANFQARLMLVPDTALIDVTRQLIDDYRTAKGEDAKLPVAILVDELIGHFGVSKEIIESRLATAGLIP